MTDITLTGELLVRKGILSEELRARILAEMNLDGRDTLPPKRFGDYAWQHLSDEQKRSLPELLRELHPALESQSVNIKRLYRKIHKGRALLFIGAGCSIPRQTDGGRSTGLTGRQLVDRLIAAASCEGVSMLQNLPLPAVARYVERKRPEVSIQDIIENACKELIPQEPLPQHISLARLNAFRFIVTTNWDRLIEDAYEEVYGRKKRLELVQRDSELRRINLDKTTLLKLHGDFDGERFDLHPPLVTLKQCIGSREKNPVLYSLLHALFAVHDIVVVGFSPDDHNFSDLYLRLYHQQKEQLGKIYIVDPGNEVFHLAGPIDAVHIKLCAEDFFRYLEEFEAGEGGGMGLSSIPPGSDEAGDTALSSPHRFWSSDMCDQARDIREALGLRHVEVVGTPTPGDVESGKVCVGRHASHLLLDWARPGDSIALGGGVTLKAMVDAVRPEWKNLKGLELYATVTPALESFSVLAPITIVSLLAERLHEQDAKSSAFQLPQCVAPLLVEEKFRDCPNPLGFQDNLPCSECKIIKSSLDNYRKRASKCKMVFLGIGSMELEYGGFQEVCKRCAELTGDETRGETKSGDEYRQLLLGEGYVGDVVYRPFQRIERRLVENESYEPYFLNMGRALEIGNEDLKRFMLRLCCNVFPIELGDIRDAARDDARQVILVASGAKKAWPVLSVCNAGLAGALVIDSALADEMLTILSHGTH